MTGWEPKYQPSRWNKNPNLRKTHNCFAYAMNVNDPKQIEACAKDPKCNVPYHQPGSASGYPGFKDSVMKSCPEMEARTRGDNPTITPVVFEQKCPAETSKIALVVDSDEDYHYYRQDKDGFWSHKPGGLQVTNKDASGRPIYDPKLADRNYNDQNSDLNYNEFCSYLCVPRMRPLFLKIGGKQIKLKSDFSVSVSRKAKRRYPLTRRFQGSKVRGTQRNRYGRKDY
jgi:hypothetical protein